MVLRMGSSGKRPEKSLRNIMTKDNVLVRYRIDGTNDFYISLRVAFDPIHTKKTTDLPANTIFQWDDCECIHTMFLYHLCHLDIFIPTHLKKKTNTKSLENLQHLGYL